MNPPSGKLPDGGGGGIGLGNGGRWKPGGVGLQFDDCEGGILFAAKFGGGGGPFCLWITNR